MLENFKVSRRKRLLVECMTVSLRMISYIKSWQLFKTGINYKSKANLNVSKFTNFHLSSLSEKFRTIASDFS